MSMNDDTCDFCGGYVDPIGGDMAVATWYYYGGLFDIPEDELWCGGCQGGQRMVDYYNEKLELYLAVQEFRHELRKVSKWLLKHLPVKSAGKDGNEK